MSRALTLVALGLAIVGCAKNDRDRVCGTLPIMFPGGLAKNASDQQQVTAYCVERWAARLAKASDPANQVADAVIGSCRDAIGFLEEFRKKENPGWAMNQAEAEAYWRRRALFIIMQVHAADCYPDA